MGTGRAVPVVEVAAVTPAEPLDDPDPELLAPLVTIVVVVVVLVVVTPLTHCPPTKINPKAAEHDLQATAPSL